MTHRNLAALLADQAERLGPRPALRYKRHGLYHDLTWGHYHEQATACAAALADAGVAPGDRVGLLAENRVEWLVADMGILAAAAVNVPPHAPLTARQIHFQLDDADVRWLFVSTTAQLDKVLAVWSELPRLEGVVLFDRLDAERAKKLPRLVHSWDAFQARGRRVRKRLGPELARRLSRLGPDDLATIMYTSGTTGNPKGVMLTHGNLLSNALASLEVQPRSPDDVVLNWLPLSHIYARTVDHYLNLASGTLVCLAESAETLVADLEEVRPTHMSSVPRFYEKVLTAVSSSDPLKTARRLRDVFGPRVEWLGSGGAPLPLPIAQAYHDAGLLVLQGYGLTESSPVISFNRRSFYKLGTVGQAIPDVEIATAPDGEVLTRGPHVMRGYWKNPQATADAIRDGWLYTGDLGKLDADGFLSITGRKKELMVLSNGKKVVPSYLEGLLLSDDCFDQVVICGEGRNYLTALVVPHWENVRRFLHERGTDVDGAPEETLATHPAVHTLLRNRLDQRLADVSGWEQVKKFSVLPRPFTVAGEELTVSLKLRRNVVAEKYRSTIEAMYRE